MWWPSTWSYAIWPPSPDGPLYQPGIWEGFLDRDRDLTTVRRLVCDHIPHLVADDCTANRRLRANHIVIGGHRDVTRTNHVLHLIATQLDGDQRTIAHLAGLGRLYDLSIAQLDDEFVDTPLILALFLARGLISAVLREVALCAGRGDAFGDLVAVFTLAMSELLLHLVVRLLREQHDLFFLFHMTLHMTRLMPPLYSKGTGIPPVPLKTRSLSAWR